MLDKDMADARGGGTVPNDLEALWLPFTPNRQFKREPRMISRAKDMHFYTPEGRAILDATAGLWCSNAGHCREPIVRAIQEQAAELDFAPSFQFAHPKAFEVASRIAQLAPGDLDHVFFANSGSEAADTALKIALAYQRSRGEGTRVRLIGRERGYHGTGFGGISVGGMPNNRKFFGPLLAGADHLPHTHLAENRFTRGEPEHGAHLADRLEDLVALHDASTIAAVIVEPFAGSTGVLPPPKGYLKRLREICDKHGIVLIFDEVITGFGRMGTAFGAEYWGVQPDIMTFAKGVTSGTVPMGGVVVRNHIYEAFQTGADHAIDLFHGYTYTAHPLACAAALASLDVYRDEGLFARAGQMAKVLEDAIHTLKGHPLVADIRNCGLAAAVDIVPQPGSPGLRGFETVKRGFFDHDIMLRITADTIAVSPPFIVTEDQIGQAVEAIRAILTSLDGG